jgi:hypothetical protein
MIFCHRKKIRIIVYADFFFVLLKCEDWWPPTSIKMFNCLKKLLTRFNTSKEFMRLPQKIAHKNREEKISGRNPKLKNKRASMPKQVVKINKLIHFSFGQCCNNYGNN